MIKLTHITRESYTPGTAGYDNTGSEPLYVNPDNLSAFKNGKVWLTGGAAFEVTQTTAQILKLIKTPAVDK